jgi:predicted AAA+ superfamily ATPase
VLRAAARDFPAVVVTGPRRSGKTHMLRRAFPRAAYFLLEDPSVVARLRADPAGFLDAVRGPAILDEVQNAPEVLALVRSRIDAAPRARGRWFLTGSQEAPLMRGVGESMAGRAAVLVLRPLAHRECDRVGLLHGGYPEAVARPRSAGLWFSSFVQTYLERDVRQVTAVRDLATFRRFLALLASRHGQLLNRTDIAAPLGVSVPTVTQWLGVLETTAQVLLVPPWYESLGKRLTKSPRVYIADSGLACHLLGIESEAALAASPFLGAIFEGFIAAEIVKAQVGRGGRPEIYGYRDIHGLEVDLLAPLPDGGVSLVECKASRTPIPTMAAPMLKVREALAARRPPGVRIEATVVHLPARRPFPSDALAPGVRAREWRDFVLDA